MYYWTPVSGSSWNAQRLVIMSTVYINHLEPILQRCPAGLVTFSEDPSISHKCTTSSLAVATSSSFPNSFLKKHQAQALLLCYCVSRTHCCLHLHGALYIALSSHHTISTKATTNFIYLSVLGMYLCDGVK